MNDDDTKNNIMTDDESKSKSKGKSATTTDRNKYYSDVSEMIPQNREVACGVSNLGNTCYMNAVLQALAHSPELCYAIDCDPHHLNSPIAQRNLERQAEAEKKKKLEEAEKKSVSEDPSSNTNTTTNTTTTTKKKKKKSNKLDILLSSKYHVDPQNNEFDILCEFEKHVIGVHQTSDRNRNSNGNSAASSASSSSSSNNNTLTTSNTTSSSSNNTNNSNSNEPSVYSPVDFVYGFINFIAPGFKVGAQEDSHEFLRLLIDAIQNSYNKAQSEQNKDKEEDTTTTTTTSNYPLQLFRGEVESTVTCSSCSKPNITYDPIEDVGLEVILKAAPGSGIMDVISSLEKFTRKENLDAQYKCEHCGAVGQATKVSKLNKIPPILTFHLKRFRYGSASEKKGVMMTHNKNVMNNNYNSASGGGHSNNSNSSSSTHHQHNTGLSGSAKIEGHIRFEQFFDIHPFLSTKLQTSNNNNTNNNSNQKNNLFVRLFAVIVHSGKNSHSGHYYAYVRNLQKNEWWKMDDSQTQRVGLGEVMQAEAYMLFYRVVDHPFGTRVKNEAHRKVKDLMEQQQKQKQKVETDNKKKNNNNNDASEVEKGITTTATNGANCAVMESELSNKTTATTTTATASSSNSSDNKTNTNNSNTLSTSSSSSFTEVESNTKKNKTLATTTTNNDTNSINTTLDSNTNNMNNNDKKRIAPTYTNGFKWARKKFRRNEVEKITPFLHLLSDHISEDVNFKVEYFQFLTQHVNEQIITTTTSTSSSSEIKKKGNNNNGEQETPPLVSSSSTNNTATNTVTNSTAASSSSSPNNNTASPSQSTNNPSNGNNGNNGNGNNGNSSLAVSPDEDVQGDCGIYRDAIRKVLYRLFMEQKLSWNSLNGESTNSGASNNSNSNKRQKSSRDKRDRSRSRQRSSKNNNNNNKKEDKQEEEKEKKKDNDIDISMNSGENEDEDFSMMFPMVGNSDNLL